MAWCSKVWKRPRGPLARTSSSRRMGVRARHLAGAGLAAIASAWQVELHDKKREEQDTMFQATLVLSLSLSRLSPSLFLSGASLSCFQEDIACHAQVSMHGTARTHLSDAQSKFKPNINPQPHDAHNTFTEQTRHWVGLQIAITNMFKHTQLQSDTEIHKTMTYDTITD
jgi:hypothetical protein